MEANVCSRSGEIRAETPLRRPISQVVSPISEAPVADQLIESMALPVAFFHFFIFFIYFMLGFHFGRCVSVLVGHRPVRCYYVDSSRFFLCKAVWQKLQKNGSICIRWSVWRCQFHRFSFVCFFGHHGVLVGRHRFRCYFLDMLRVPNKIFCKCWLRNLAINRRCLFGHISKWFRRSIEFISVFRGFQRDFEQLVLRWPTSSFRWLPHWFIFEDFSPKKNVDRHSNQLFRRLDLNFSFLFKCSSAFPSADETFL